jgi:hypothetical protein
LEAPKASCQSKENTKDWKIEWIKGESGSVWSDPLMGWTGSEKFLKNSLGTSDPVIQLQNSQAKRFRTKEEAIEYAKRNGFNVIEDTKGEVFSNVTTKSYAAQFDWEAPQENNW